MKPITTLILDTRKEKKSGKFPVKIRITFMRQQKYYPVWIDLDKQEFQLIQNLTTIPKNSDIAVKRRLKALRMDCNKELVKATSIIDKMEMFSYRTFEKHFYRNEKTLNDVYSFYIKTIEEKRSIGKVGTASGYRSSMNSLKAFSPKLNFSDVTNEFLKEYEKWLLANRKSITTVGIYLRPLRSIINHAIAEGIFSQDNYPFGKRKYQVPTGKNIKKALTSEEIEKIYNYVATKGDWWQKARDFFIFSYLACGMNMKDILMLKYENIDGEFIRFFRAKTHNTNRSGSKPISIPINSELNVIIERWKGISNNEDDFIFDILQKDLSPDRERSIIQQFTKMVNRYIGLIAIEVGVNKKVTTYYARHSFATMLKRGGVSTEFISEALGHSNIITTRSYLDSFDDESKRVKQSILTQFK